MEPGHDERGRGTAISNLFTLLELLPGASFLGFVVKHRGEKDYLNRILTHYSRTWLPT